VVEPQWLFKDSSKKKNMSKTQEKKTKHLLLQKGFNARLTPGSGNKSIKGDIQTESLMIECKITEKEQFVVKLKDLQKLLEESMNVMKEPVFEFQFCGGQKFTNYTWSAIPQSRLYQLLETEQKYLYENNS